jgi:hypothetical protein
METSKTNSIGTRVLDFSKRFLSHRYLPAILAIGAILVMLPAVKTGLVLDDLMQRAVELKPSQLPPRMFETGNPADSGSLGTVLCDLFGFSRDPQNMALMKNYGTLPWWCEGENVLPGAFDIYPESETFFFDKLLCAQYIFVKNDKGEVTAVIHHLAGFPDSEGKKLKKE